MVSTPKRVAPGDPESNRVALARTGAGDLSVEVAMGADDDAAIVFARIENGDTVARNGRIEILDASDNVLITLASGSINAGESLEFLNNANPSLGISDAEKLKLTLEAVADLEDGVFAYKLRQLGAAPTVTSVDGS